MGWLDLRSGKPIHKTWFRSRSDLTPGRDASHVFRFIGWVLSRNLALYERVDDIYVQPDSERKRNLQYALPLLPFNGRHSRGDERRTGTTGNPACLPREGAV